MSAYGVPDDLDGALPWDWAQQRLVSNHNYWVGTVGSDGRPHSTPVWGVWDAATDRFYFSCAPDSLKARNVATNPHVVVTVDDTVEMVSVEGVAAPADSSGEAATAAAATYAEKYEPDPQRRPGMVEFMLSHAVYEVVPTKAIGVIEREDDFARRATRWVF